MKKKKPQNAVYDAFISYSHEDREFADKLEKALENYRPPSDIEGVPQRRLNIFRDENDFLGTEYFSAIENTIDVAPKLILLCSPDARSSSWVNDEIRRFVKKYPPNNIIPIIVRGIPNNEAGKNDEDKKAFPEALMELMEMPLAVSYADVDWRHKSLTKGLLQGSWFTILANLLDVRRDKLERRELLRQRRAKRRLAIISSVVGALILTALIFAVVADVKKRRAELTTHYLTQAQKFEEKAGRALQLGSADGYQKAWLYTLAALKQKVETSRTPVSLARLQRKAIAFGANIEQSLWVSPSLPEPAERVVAGPDGRYFASADALGRVSLWSGLTGQELTSWQAHDYRITGMAFSAGADELATVGVDSLIKIWSLENNGRTVILEAEEHCDDSLTDVFYIPEKHQYVASGLDGSIYVPHRKAAWWKLFLTRRAYATGVHKSNLFGRENHAEEIFFYPDGKDFIARSRQGHLYQHKSGEGNQATPLPFLKEPVSDFSVDSLGTTLAAITPDSLVKIWRLEDPNQVYEAEGRFTAVAINRSGRAIAAAGGGDIALFSSEESEWHRATLLAGYGAKINHLLFLSDSTLLASDSDGAFSLWDIRSGAKMAESRGHKSDINAVAFSPNDSLLASGENDGSILLWDTRSGRLAKRLSGHQSVIETIRFNNKGDKLFSGDKSGVLICWDADSFKKDTLLLFPRKQIWEIAFSPGDSLVALATRQTSAPKENSIYVLSSDSLKIRHVLNGHSLGVSGLFFLPNGKGLLSAARDSLMILWDLAEEKPILRWQAHEGEIYGLAANSTKPLVATASTDETVRQWRLDRLESFFLEGEDADEFYLELVGKKGVRLIGDSLIAESYSARRKKKFIEIIGPRSVWRISLEKGGLNGYQSDGIRWYTSLSLYDELLAWQRQGSRLKLRCTGDLVKGLRGHFDEVWEVAYSSNGNLLASGSGDAGIKLWYVDTGVEIATLKGHNRDVFGLAFSNDNSMLASASFDHTVRLWDLVKVYNPQNFIMNRDTVRSVAVSSDGRYLVYGGLDRRVHLREIDPATCAVSAEEKSPAFAEWSFIQSVAISPDNRYVAYGSADDRVRLWQPDSLNRFYLLGHRGDGLSVAFSPNPDSLLLASGSSDGSIRIWRMADVASGKKGQFTTLNAHKEKVRSVVFSSNGRMMASSGSDKMVFIWKVDYNSLKWQKVRTIAGHNDGVWGVAFSPNNNLLATGSWDFTIRIWNIRSGDKLWTLRGHSGPVTSLSFLDPSTLVSVSRDHSVRLWNLQTGVQSDMFDLHSAGVNSVSTNRKHNLIATAASDKSVRLQFLSAPNDSLGKLTSDDFATLFDAYEYLLPYQMRDGDLVHSSRYLYMTPLRKDAFEPGGYSGLNRVRPVRSDPIQWVLKSLKNQRE